MASSSDEQPKPPEPPAAPPHAEWAASLQAYYAAAGHHYWPAQHLMAAAAAAGVPYGSPVPFPAAAVYHPGAAAAYYAHASMAAGVPYPAGEAVAAVTAEGRTKGKDGGSGVSPEKVSSAAPSGDDASRSDDSGSEASLDTKGADSDQKDSSAAKKTKLGNSSAEGEPSQVAVMQYAVAESPYVAKGRSASKLPVSAPGRTALPSATPNLNIGIDLWSTSPAGAVPSGQGEVNTGMTLARQDSTASQLDEREWKRERRKQSNRESARRSRLRKQQECEELARRVNELTTENSALRSELDQLKKACKDMEAENSRLMAEMMQSQGPGDFTTLGIQGSTSKAHDDNNGHVHKHSNKNSNGNFLSGSHKTETKPR